MTRILVIEDERDLARGLADNLELEGYEVVLAHSGEEGVEQLTLKRPDLIVLDLMLPFMSGFEVLTRVREQYDDVPVLILSARTEEVDKVRGFRAGADDYVTKPFGVLELTLRVRSLLKRAGKREEAGEHPPSPNPRVRVGDVEVDLVNRVVLRSGEEIPLTPKAVELLVALVARRDTVVTRHDLLRQVWGYGKGVTTRTVDAHIAELRKKIEVDPSHPRYILTVWKAGYRLRV